MDGAGSRRPCQGVSQVATSTLERMLIDRYQREFPLVPRPYKAIADDVGASETEVIEAFSRLSDAGAISRIGAVVAPHRAGWSTLAAMAVPSERLEEVAGVVSGYEEVNHNYQREHEINLWFVVAAPDRTRVAEVLKDVAERTGLDVLDLPMIEAYRLDLGFPLQWT